MFRTRQIANRVNILCSERFSNNIPFSCYSYRNYEDYCTPTANIVDLLYNIDLMPEFSRDTSDSMQYDYLAAAVDLTRMVVLLTRQYPYRKGISAALIIVCLSQMSMIVSQIDYFIRTRIYAKTTIYNLFTLTECTTCN